jgi:hypothetical protein
MTDSTVPELPQAMRRMQTLRNPVLPTAVPETAKRPRRPKKAGQKPSLRQREQRRKRNKFFCRQHHTDAVCFLAFSLAQCAAM